MRHGEASKEAELMTLAHGDKLHEDASGNAHIIEDHIGRLEERITQLEAQVGTWKNVAYRREHEVNALLGRFTQLEAICLNAEQASTVTANAYMLNPTPARVAEFCRGRAAAFREVLTWLPAERRTK